MSQGRWCITPFAPERRAEEIAALAGLWNLAAAEAHGFFPLTAGLFQHQVVDNARFRPGNLLLARVGGQVVGLVHCDLVNEPYYPQSGTVSALGVHPAWRRRGLGGALLDAALARLSALWAGRIDGGGSWPFDAFYAGLLDGSERSGVRPTEAALWRLFASRGFAPTRESVILRRSLAGEGRAFCPRDLKLVWRPRTEKTWLDQVFRAWRLYDHGLCNERGETLSRAICARMTGWSDHAGRERYAIFGVHTPPEKRRQGWAELNLRLLLAGLAEAGGQEAELHVYADNEPAWGLYRKLGFKEIGRTWSLCRPG